MPPPPPVYRSPVSWRRRAERHAHSPPPGGQKAAVEATFCADVAEELQKSRSKIKEKTFFFGKYKNILKKLLTKLHCDDNIIKSLVRHNKIAMERYRSGHNGAVLKTVCLHGRMGSNPILSAENHL